MPHIEEKERYFELAKQRQPHPLKPETVFQMWDKWQLPMWYESIVRLPKGVHLSEAFIEGSKRKYGLHGDFFRGFK